MLEFWDKIKQIPLDHVHEILENVHHDPEDLESRIILAAFYMCRPELPYHPEQPDQASPLFHHLLWVIQNAPQSTFLALSFFFNKHERSEDEYDVLKSAWFDHLDTDPDDCLILDNAAYFFQNLERHHAIDCLRRAYRIEPDSAHWIHRLIYSYEYGVRYVVNGETRPDMNTCHPKLALHQSACSALEDQNFIRAQWLAEKLFSQDTRDEAVRAYCHFEGFQLLGRIALARNNLDEAFSCLYESSRMDNLQAVELFRFHTELPARLLDLDATDEVIQYYQRYAQHEPRDVHITNRWIREIQDTGLCLFA